MPSKSESEKMDVESENAETKEEEIVKATPNKTESKIEIKLVNMGVLIQKLEHQSRYPFCYIRVTYYKNENVLKTIKTWETSMSQEGASGNLGVYEWEQRKTFKMYDLLFIF